MAAFQGCWASMATSVNSSQLSSLQVPNLCVSQVGCCHSRRSRVRCSYQEDFPLLKEKLRGKEELNLPLQPKETDVDREALVSAVKTLEDVSPQEAKEALKAAKEKYGKTIVTKALQEAKRKFGKQGAGKLALFGGVATLGVILSGAVLTSLEVLPLVPEAMQMVGMAYSVLVASRVLQGKPGTLTMSPVKAVIEIVDEGKKSKVQRTSLVLPQDLDEGVVAAMERLAQQRDAAVNQVAEMKQQTSEYSRILTEKEALETVALQLAEERETAMSEVNALKSAVELMTERMKGIEAMLAKEVGQLKTQNQALETVALQLAQERNSALQEVAKLQEVIKAARSDTEKQALQEVAVKLAQERDSALSELESLKKVVANLRTEGVPMGGFTHEQDLFIETRVKDIRSQLLEGQVPPREEVDKLISHIVDEFQVQPPSVGP